MDYTTLQLENKSEELLSSKPKQSLYQMCQGYCQLGAELNNVLIWFDGNKHHHSELERLSLSI